MAWKMADPSSPQIGIFSLRSSLQQKKYYSKLADAGILSFEKYYFYVHFQ